MKNKNIALMSVAGILIFILSIAIDNQISSFFKNIDIPFLNFAFEIITNFGFVLAVMLALPCLILYRKNKKAIKILILASVLSILLSLSIKLIFLRERPMGMFTYPFTSILDYSFPSMHAVVVFSLLPLLLEYLPRYRKFWIGFAFLVAFTRVYLGFHFLSDAVFGIIFGYFIGILLLHLNNRGKLWKAAKKSG